MLRLCCLICLRALAYFAAVFALGFGLGAVRVLLLEPRIGALGAVACELPVMLAASWLLARRLTRPPALAPARARLAMGALAFALLIGAEFALGVWGFGRSPAQWLGALGSPPGALGLAGQVLFGLMPLIARRGRSAG